VAESAAGEAPLRILLISGSMPPMRCGVGDYTERLAHALALAGQHVTVLTSTAAGATNTPFSTLPRIGNWDARCLAAARETARDLAPHVVHLQYPSIGYERRLSPSWLPAALQALTPVLVQTWHDVPSRKGRFRYLPNALTRDTVVSVLPGFVERLPRWFRACSHRKSFVHVPAGSNIPAAAVSATERDARRRALAPANRLLVAYFGFVTPRKGLELLLAACDSQCHQLALVCELDPRDVYHARILGLLDGPRWRGRATVTGHLPAEQVAATLAAADVVVLPFLAGADDRNGSWLAARAQGTLVVTTHPTRRGYVARLHTHFVASGDASSIRTVLEELAPSAVPRKTTEIPDWSSVAQHHLLLYRRLLENTGARHRGSGRSEVGDRVPGWPS
jgi:glycosyltransferase involved in cell wall biosynthesis